MTEQDHRNLDGAIDRTVRDLMNVDTSRAFEARVVAAIHRTPTFGTWSGGCVALAGLTAAVLFVAANLTETPAPLDSGISTNRTQPAVASAPGVPEPVPNPGGQAAGADQPPKPGAPAGDDRRVLQGTLQRRTTTSQELPAEAAAPSELQTAPAVRVPPMMTLEPIDPVPLEMRAMAMAEIVIEPLAFIEEVQIAPLPPLTERD